MNLRPLQDWAVIRKSEPEEKTAGGIIIPDVAKEQPLEGMIVAIGPGRYKIEKGKEKEKKKKFIPTILKPGQKVIYQEYSEREIELDGQVITLVREEDILGTIEDYGIEEKKTHAIQEKKGGSVVKRPMAHVPAVSPAAVSREIHSAVGAKSPKKKPAAKKAAASRTSSGKKKRSAKETKPVKKASAKKTAKKSVSKPTPKKTPKKTVKKTVPKKTAKKTAKKTVSVRKKTQATGKKAVSGKKTAAKKVAPKKTAAKKTAPKKSARPVAAKASAKKTVKKAKGKKK